MTTIIKPASSVQMRCAPRPIRSATRHVATRCTASPQVYQTIPNGSSEQKTILPTPLPTLPQPSPSPECAPPAGILEKAIALGTTKASYSLPKTFLGGILAGALLSFGAATALAVGGACPAIAAANPGLAKILMGSIGLPFGLTMVVVSGGELFTGNTCFVTAAALAGRARWSAVLSNWVSAYAGNMVGSLAVVGLMCIAGVFAPGAAAPVNVAVAKTSAPFAQVKPYHSAVLPAHTQQSVYMFYVTNCTLLLLVGVYLHTYDRRLCVACCATGSCAWHCGRRWPRLPFGASL